MLQELKHDISHIDKGEKMRKQLIAIFMTFCLSLGVTGCRSANSGELNSNTAEKPVTETGESTTELTINADPTTFTVDQIKDLINCVDSELALSSENGFSNSENYANQWAIISMIDIMDGTYDRATAISSSNTVYGFIDSANYESAFETAYNVKVIGYIKINDDRTNYQISKCVYIGCDEPDQEDLYVPPEEITEQQPAEIIYLNDFDLSNSLICKQLSKEYDGMTGVLSFTISNLSPGGVVFGENCGFTITFDSPFDVLGYPIGSTITVMGTISSDSFPGTIRNPQIL